MAKKVLIVEDEIFVALEIEDVVRRAGFTVSAIAADRAGAMAAAPDSDFAFVDLNLRDGLTGPAIGHALSSLFGVQVIYVTANPAQIGAAQEAALGVITKPFREATIRDALLAAADEDAADFPAIAGFIPFERKPGSSIAWER